MAITFSLNAGAGGAAGPRSEADLTALREHVSVVLWETVEATFPAVRPETKKKRADRPEAPTPPMLAVRLKALEQIAKLYDLRLSSRAGVFAPEPYATPEEIAGLVRERLLELHGWGAGGEREGMTNDE